MHMMYFTEQPMAAYDAKAGLDFGATALNFSNSHYDPVKAAGCITSIWKNTSWPRNAAPTASC